GDYVAYYASYGSWRSHMKVFRIFGRELGRIEMDDDRRRHTPRDRARWGLRVSIPGTHDDAVDTAPPRSPPDPTVVAQITGVGDNALEQRGITLRQRMPLTVYCIGEFDAGGAERNDYGWILDARTRKKVWELDRDNYKHAGGARINKFARET